MQAYAISFAGKESSSTALAENLIRVSGRDWGLKHFPQSMNEV